MNRRIFCLFIILISFIVINSQEISPEDKLKKEKLMGCLNLSKARITKDQFYIDEMIDLMIIRTGGDKKEKTDKLISMILLSCYKRVNESQIAKLNKLESEEIDPMTNENKDLLQLEKWKEYYEQNDISGLQKELNKLNDAMKEINQQEAAMNQEEKFEEDVINENTKKSDHFGLFGINFNEISHEVKNFVGISLLVLILVAVVYALMMLTAKKEKKEKKKQ